MEVGLKRILDFSVNVWLFDYDFEYLKIVKEIYDMNMLSTRGETIWIITILHIAF